MDKFNKTRSTRRGKGILQSEFWRLMFAMLVGMLLGILIVVLFMYMNAPQKPIPESPATPTPTPSISATPEPTTTTRTTTTTTAPPMPSQQALPPGQVDDPGKPHQKIIIDRKDSYGEKIKYIVSKVVDNKSQNYIEYSKDKSLILSRTIAEALWSIPTDTVTLDFIHTMPDYDKATEGRKAEIFISKTPVDLITVEEMEKALNEQIKPDQKYSGFSHIIFERDNQIFLYIYVY